MKTKKTENSTKKTIDFNKKLENFNKKSKDYFSLKAQHALVFLDMKWADPKNFFSKRTQHILRTFIVLLLLTMFLVGILSLLGNALATNTKDNLLFGDQTKGTSFSVDTKTYVNAEIKPFIGLIYGENQSQLSWGIGLGSAAMIGALAQMGKLYGKNANSKNFANAVTNQIVMVIAIGLLSNSYALIPLLFAFCIQAIVTYHAVAVTYLKKPMFEVVQPVKA